MGKERGREGAKKKRKRGEEGKLVKRREEGKGRRTERERGRKRREGKGEEGREGKAWDRRKERGTRGEGRGRERVNGGGSRGDRGGGGWRTWAESDVDADGIDAIRLMLRISGNDVESGALCTTSEVSKQPALTVSSLLHHLPLLFFSM